MIVFYDFETAGLERSHPNTQIAAIACDEETGVELSAFESLIKFDANNADPGALILNHYDQARWASAPESDIVRRKFVAWLEPFKTITRISKRTGNPYRIARLAGYNAAVFDDPRMRDWFGDEFLPAYSHTLDVKFLADWYFHFIGVEVSLKLTNVCGLLGIEITKAHDALADVRATAAVAFELKKRMGWGDSINGM